MFAGSLPIVRLRQSGYRCFAGWQFRYSPLHLFQIGDSGGCLRLPSLFHQDIFGADYAAFTQDDRFFDGVLQLPYIAR